MHEDVKGTVGVVKHQVGSVRTESHIAAISANGRPITELIPLDAGTIHADPSGHAGLAIMHEDVIDIVSVVSHQAGSPRTESHIVATSANGSQYTFPIPLDTVTVHADPSGHTRVDCYRPNS